MGDLWYYFPKVFPDTVAFGTEFSLSEGSSVELCHTCHRLSPWKRKGGPRHGYLVYQILRQMETVWKTKQNLPGRHQLWCCKWLHNNISRHHFFRYEITYTKYLDMCEADGTTFSDGTTWLYDWLRRSAHKTIQGITLQDWIKSATNPQMDVQLYCKHRVHSYDIRGGGIEIAAYAIQLNATRTVWEKVPDYNGQHINE